MDIVANKKKNAPNRCTQTKTNSLKYIHKLRNKTVRTMLLTLLRLVLILMLSISMIPLQTLFTHSAKAFAKDTVEFVLGETIKYNVLDAFTHNMKCDGVPAFCIDPTLTSPPSGTYVKQPLNPTGTSIENYKALMWFGWGGPGFDPSMWPSNDYYGNPMTETTYYIITHLIDSYFYYYSNTASAINCLDSIQNSWIRSNIFGWKLDRPYDDFESDTFANRCFARSGEVPAGFECFIINPGGATQSIVGFTATCALSLYKESAYTSFTSDNPLYRTNGIVYDIFSDEGCTSQIGALTCDASGKTESLEVPSGVYYAKEREDSCIGSGYALDTSIHRIDASSGQTNVFGAKDRPQFCIPDILISKTDLETEGKRALGAASLEGAEFQVDHYAGYFSTFEDAQISGSTHKSWIFRSDEDGNVRFDASYMVSGDDLYRNDTGQIVLPLGTLVIKETTAPLGYTLGEPTIFIIHIESSGNTEIISAPQSSTQPDRIKRGDLKFIKVKENGMERLAEIPFCLTSETTGESHIIFTDENGFFSSEASWIPHTEFTNANDIIKNELTHASIQAGIWFSGTTEKQTPPDDAFGALPFDTYTLQELECQNNKGLEMVRLEHISIKRDTVTVDLGTIIDPAIQTQYISTTAYDSIDLDKKVISSKQSKVLDAVEYLNLSPGKEYKLVTQLAEVTTGELLCDTYGPITRERTFIPEGPNGKINVEVEVDTSAYPGSQIVFYERLFDGDTLLAEDVDEANTDQMIRVVGPSIFTHAASKADGGKSIPCSNNISIVDTVSYSDLIVGEEYTLEGKLMYLDSEDEAYPVKTTSDDDVTSIVSFIAQKATGSQNVTFIFDSSGYANETSFVVFEKLYLDNVLIAEHADKNDANQTVSLELPSLKTVASKYGDDTKLIPASMDSKVEDSIAYEGLEVGSEYKVIGILIDKNTGYPLSSDAYTYEGSKSPDATNFENHPYIPVDVKEFFDEFLELLELGNVDKNLRYGAEGPNSTSFPNDSSNLPKPIDQGELDSFLESYMNNAVDIPFTVAKFVPESSAGNMSMNFECDMYQLSNRRNVVEAVAFEYLIKDGNLVAVHADMDDVDQSFYVVPASLITTAKDAIDDDNIISPNTNSQVIDRVYYTGLIPGTPYRIEGVLVDKSSGNTIFNGDEPVTSYAEFTPESTDGYEDVSFKFDASNMVATQLVVFEYLLQDGIEVASHTDLNSEDQTIIVSADDGTPLAQTGDTSRDLRWVAALLPMTLTTALASLAVIKKRNSMERFNAARQKWRKDVLKNIMEFK